MITIYFDGACGPNNLGGKCGGGAVIKNGNELIKEIVYRYKPKRDGETSNNVGEYIGLIKALEYLIKEKLNDEIILVYGDSNMVINQMEGGWKIKKGIYKEQALEAKKLKEFFKTIKFQWIPREENEWADALSKQALEIDL